MSRFLRASVQLHDGDAWRLPNWEEYSESGCSAAAWSDTDAGTEGGWRAPTTSDDDADDDDDGADGSDRFSRGHDGDDAALSHPARMRRRRPSGVAIPCPPPSTVTSARSPATMTRMARDLRALHERFALQRQQEKDHEPANTMPREPTPQADVTAQQAQIASQLQDVREQLVDFQRRWQSAVDSDKQPQAGKTQNTEDSSNGRRCFDMAVQTDVVFHDDALLQWLQLITQKVDVLASSFHGDTTQLPIRYPLQPHLHGDQVPLSPAAASAARTDPSPPSLSSWHVGRALEHLVAPATAARLLDVERAIACLATATQQTTSRYVEYFERIVSQIQEIHQQRLQQVVDESLKELKTQRAKHKKRVEQLDQECQTAKMMAEEWREKAAIVSQRGMQDRERAASLVEAAQREATQENEQWRRRLQQLQDELQATSEQHEDAQRRLQAQSSELQQAKSLVQELMTSLETAQREMDRTKRDATAQSTDLMAALHDRETTIRKLQQQLVTAQATHQSATQRAELEFTTQRDTLEQQINELSQREQSLRSSHDQELAALEERWRQRLQDAVEDTKRCVEQSKPSVASQECQTDLDDELWEDATASTDERIARLKRRCRALEGLLEKKFEVASSVAGSMSPRSSLRSSLCSSPRQSVSTWSVSAKEPDSRHDQKRSPDYRHGDMTGTTLPLTSFELSFEDVVPPVSPDGHRKQQWETTSWADGGSSSGRSSQVTVSAASLPPPSDAPSTEDMMALVRKLEHLATRPEKRRSKMPQPDEEPEMEPPTPMANRATIAQRSSRRRDDATLKRTRDNARERRIGSTHMTTANAAAKKRVPLRATDQQTLSRR